VSANQVTFPETLHHRAEEELLSQSGTGKFKPQGKGAEDSIVVAGGRLQCASEIS
jgi:hypothetical protein